MACTFTYIISFNHVSPAKYLFYSHCTDGGEMNVKYIDSLVQGHNAKQCQNQDLYPSPPEL